MNKSHGLSPLSWVICFGRVCGPGNETVVAGVYLFKLAFDFSDLGRASMMSIFLIIGLPLIATLYMKLVTDRKMNAI
ncbi:MAG: hypothetical protein V3U76_14230 [Granulosicoccus sp.]